eukprot:2175971-Prymnesium_polylepis.1
MSAETSSGICKQAHDTPQMKTAPLRRSQEWPLRAAFASRAARGSPTHLHACLRFRTAESQERAPNGIAASPPGSLDTAS